MALSDSNKIPTAKVAVRGRVSIDGTSYDCVSMQHAISEAHEVIKIASLGAAWEVAVPGAIGKAEPFEVKILKGATKPVCGSVCQLVVEVEESVNGGQAVSDSITVQVAVTAVKADSIEADGNRVETWSVTLQPTNLDKSNA